MDIINVPSKIVFIADRVFPVAPLPKRKLAVGVAPNIRALGKQSGAEMTFDSPPAAGKVGVVLRQCEDRVKVVRQDYNRIDRKGTLFPSCPKSHTKRRDMIDENR